MHWMLHKQLAETGVSGQTHSVQSPHFSVLSNRTRADVLSMVCKSCYDDIADEYYDPRHITSRNFETTTERALRTVGCGLPDRGLILDLGSGRGAAHRYCRVRSTRVVHVDLSPRMLRLRPREASSARILADAMALPVRDRTIGAVVAFLYDPFNVPGFYGELGRTLAVGGVFLGSLPHLEWGSVLRRLRGYPLDEAHMLDRAGGTVARASFLMDEQELRTHLLAAGLERIDVWSASMPRGSGPLSPDLVEPAEVVGVSPHELPFVTLVRAEKAA